MTQQSFVKVEIFLTFALDNLDTFQVQGQSESGLWGCELPGPGQAWNTAQQTGAAHAGHTVHKGAEGPPALGWAQEGRGLPRRPREQLATPLPQPHSWLSDKDAPDVSGRAAGAGWGP